RISHKRRAVGKLFLRGPSSPWMAAVSPMAWRSRRAHPHPSFANSLREQAALSLPSASFASPHRGGRELAQSCQCRLQAFDFGGVMRVVGAGLFDRFGLGFLDESRVFEALGEAVALLDRGVAGLGETSLLRRDV